MSIANEYLIYGMEEYKAAHALTGSAVARIFARYKVSDYVRRHYAALHTMGGKYFVQDIDDYMKLRS